MGVDTEIYHWFKGCEEGINIRSFSTMCRSSNGAV